MTTCIICGKTVPENRKRKDTCSITCGLIKAKVVALYQNAHKKEIVQKAIEEYYTGRTET